METLKDKINTLIEDYQRRFKTIKKEIAKGGNDITLTRLGTKASEYQTFVSELSRLKDEGEDSNVLNPDVNGQNFPNDYVKTDYTKPAEQSDKLTAEEIFNKIFNIPTGELPIGDKFIKFKTQIIKAMGAYHSQFVGEKVTDEILKEELVKFAEFKDAMKRIHDLTNNEMVVNNYLKKRQPIVEQKHSGTD